MKEKAPIMLIILDGWGVGEQNDYNAVYQASTPNMDRWQHQYPATTLIAHAGAVGLPEGQMGNSEVGHLNIGAGRVVYQDLTRINKAVDGGELDHNEVMNQTIQKTIAKGGALHFFGLVSDGGVHSHIDHLKAMVKTAGRKGLEKIFIHCFMDGRDTPQKSGIHYIHELRNELTTIGYGAIATVCGRYYAMDRDNRWPRVERAWRAIVDGKGRESIDPVQAVKDAYSQGKTDEFIEPTIIVQNGKPVATVNDNDSIIFFNFRADRARQLTHAFIDPQFENFSRPQRPQLADFITCTQYENNLPLSVLFPPLSLDRILSQEVCRNNLKQLRIAETEKYAHVTYFFNGGREDVFENEDRLLIDSPRDVATYDLKPEMSAGEVTDKLLERLESCEYDLIVLNYANSDMVGHTGILSAAIKACETVDSCLGRLVPGFVETGGTVMITADHGNAEIMFDEENQMPHTAHSLNPVPFILISDRYKDVSLKKVGVLRDIAPTILTIMNLPVPEDMDGESLIIDNSGKPEKE